MSPLDFTKEVQTRLGVLADGKPEAITLAALDKRLPRLVPAEPITVILPRGELLTEDTLALAIIAQGRRYVGLKEVRPNAEWDNPSTPGPDTDLVKELRERMRRSTWREGSAYCAAFVEAVVVAALEQCGATPAQIKRYTDVMSPHCMTSFRGFAELGFTHAVPKMGSIWLAQHGSTDQGHAGIVARTEGVTSMLTIEANTSGDRKAPSAQQREGDWIISKPRMTAGEGDLHTRGFVRPSSILRLCGIA